MWFSPFSDKFSRVERAGSSISIDELKFIEIEIKLDRYKVDLIGEHSNDETSEGDSDFSSDDSLKDPDYLPPSDNSNVSTHATTDSSNSSDSSTDSSIILSSYVGAKITSNELPQDKVLDSEDLIPSSIITGPVNAIVT